MLVPPRHCRERLLVHYFAVEDHCGRSTNQTSTAPGRIRHVRGGRWSSSRILDTLEAFQSLGGQIESVRRFIPGAIEFPLLLERGARVAPQKLGGSERQWNRLG